jgi:NFU1 iron-sulfur cluster scaffold homolog, mitochondrial
MADAAVRFQPTPNPNAGKFVAGRTVVEGKSSRSFYSAEQAAADPLAAALFELQGVASIFMVDDFVTVTKAVNADWSELIPQVTETMERVLS